MFGGRPSRHGAGAGPSPPATSPGALLQTSSKASPSLSENSGHTGQRGSGSFLSSFLAHSFNKCLLSQALCQLLGINTHALYDPICD